MSVFLHILAGTGSGTLCALGGALKDVRFEPFSMFIFLRSVAIGTFWGATSIWTCNVSPSETCAFLLLFAFCGYMERITTEGWKIVRGTRPGKFRVG